MNWRATARRGELWVNQQQAERNADVLLFLDTFTEASRDGRSTLDLALRAAASLTARYMQQKDRVGFVTFGGMLNWLLPSTGTAQLYRLVDSLIDTQIVLNYAWRDIDVLHGPGDVGRDADLVGLDIGIVGRHDLAAADVPVAARNKRQRKQREQDPAHRGATRCADAFRQRACPSPSGTTSAGSPKGWRR